MESLNLVFAICLGFPFSWITDQQFKSLDKGGGLKVAWKEGEVSIVGIRIPIDH